MKTAKASAALFTFELSCSYVKQYSVLHGFENSERRNLVAAMLQFSAPQDNTW